MCRLHFDFRIFLWLCHFTDNTEFLQLRNRIEFLTICLIIHSRSLKLQQIHLYGQILTVCCGASLSVLKT